MNLVYARLCSYRAENGILCRCDLHVYRDGDAAVVVATERKDNPGPSITNSYDHLATSIWQKMKLPFEHTTWIEHYSDDSYAFPIEKRFDWVALVENGERLISPRWRPGSREAVEFLIGQPFEAST